MLSNALKSNSKAMESAYSIIVNFLVFDLFEKKRLKKKSGGFIEEPPSKWYEACETGAVILQRPKYHL
jgi:hypothetical protein